MLASFEQDSGRPAWLREHPIDRPVASLVADRDQLIVSVGGGVAASNRSGLYGLDLETGALNWAMPAPYGGHLAVGHGLVYLSSGDFLTAYAPAERTFRLAIDSDRSKHYHADPAGFDEKAKDPECQQQDPGLTPSRTRLHPSVLQDQKAPTPLRGLADATILRLTFGQPLEKLLQAARERRQLCEDLPRVLILDWFTPDRTARQRANGHQSWNPETTAEFIQACQRLAAEFQPDHFELASDVNAYLAYHPSHVEEIRSLLRAARQAIRRVSPRTRTLISFNAEVLNGTYGRGRYFPFQDVPRQPDEAVQRQLSLLEEVDEAGLTTAPQSGNIGPEQVLGPYLLNVVARFGNRPLLVTRITAAAQDPPPTGMIVQAAFLKRIQRCLYWLNALVVACPGLDGEAGSTTALVTGADERPALDVWKQMLAWRRVERLTALNPVASR